MEFLLIVLIVACIVLAVKNQQNLVRAKDLRSQLSEREAAYKQLETLSHESEASLKEVLEMKNRLEGTLADARTTCAELDKKLGVATSDLSLTKRNLDAIRMEWERYEAEIKLLKSIEALKADEQQLKVVSSQLNAAKKELDLTLKGIDELQTLRDGGFYSLKYEFEDVQSYKEALVLIKERQKHLITSSTEFHCEVEELRGTPIFKAIKSIALRSFNLEIESIAESVTTRNFDSSYEKAQKAFERINTLLTTFRSKITEEYFESKVKEIAIALEFEQEKARIKEEQAELRRKIKDEEDARLEAEELRDRAAEAERLAAEQLEKAKILMAAATAEEKLALEEKVASLEEALREKSEEKERAISMAQITKKGHVYIISNIGSFGEDVFKIGLTRRDNPEDRVRELGDASVPFLFDIHATIKCEDAPRLESELHRLLNNHRMNKVNSRKEFFRVTIDIIQDACSKLGHQVELTRLAEAREFRQTLEIEKQAEAA